MRCESALFCEIEDRVAVECDTCALANWGSLERGGPAVVGNLYRTEGT